MEKNRITTGGYPRAFTEFGLLRDEISKLTHPARPDVDWHNVEQLSLTLFRHNGVELQTLAWYTVGRIRNAGLMGLAEGAELMEALLTHHWSAIWPQQTHARVEILAWLSARLQQELRTLTLSYADLSMVYRVEQSLKHVCEVLQRLELKALSKLEAVVTWMRNAALRLEKAEADSGAAAVMIPASGATINVDTSLPQLVFVVNKPVSPEQSGATVFATQNEQGTRRMWLGFAVGVMVTAVVSTGAFLGITHMRTDGYELVKPLPQRLTPEQLSTLRQSSDLQEQKQEIITATQGQLDVLHDLSPLWSREYAASLAQQLVTLWPEESQTTTFVSGLQKALTTEALPESALQNWHDAQQGLEALTARLNTLDERKGKYLTGSELKSAIFTIRHQLDQTPPTEELLRQIDDELKKQGSVSPALYQQLDMRINQLLNRYALLKQSATGRE
ncbi:VasL domain-containing protein [Citrobacter sp. RHBSTW-00671]|uniref:VasL domain-containing protein n=1 Tax=Citrobacter sp. RHBSTW-00671 TaxID=2742660 RepID=UPI001839C34E|nr:VasL domain-containing protein [Citrobacter sp. RHBSTW-00671]MBA7965978.1 type VI secretion system ImpA family N-terminal domain-containing protein [Citrobacter sp. RHBSTW-00671]HCJ6376235.1 type VI secretion system ImpA family N-terminal domain-containing protein [Citrobacter freundii]